jgi:hypothetical protein
MFHKKITAKTSKVLNKKAKTKPEPQTEAQKLANENQHNPLVAQVVNPTPERDDGYNFRVASKFMLDGTIYSVRRVYEEGNVTQIRVHSLENGEEIIMLDSLKRDAKTDPGFKVLEP